MDLNKVNKGGGLLHTQICQQDHNIEPDTANSSTLCFDSAFESGNLFAAFKINDNEYDLILQNDINTEGNTQWFFFSIGNTRKGKHIKFNIINLVTFYL